MPTHSTGKSEQELRGRASADRMPLQQLLEALPAAALVANQELRVSHVNRRATAQTERSAEAARPGDLLGCVHALRAAGGCGTEVACSTCPLRSSVTEALLGANVVQREVRVETRSGASIFLLSASPLLVAEEAHALVLLQDVTSLHRLRGLIPICAQCKSIRRDDDAWQVLESYIEEHSHAEFTHGVCPTCRDRLYPARGPDACAPATPAPPPRPHDR